MNYIECKEKKPFDDSPRKIDVENYLSEHKINELIQNLTSLVLYYQPESPRKFMIEQLLILEKSMDNTCDPPSLFTEKNVESVFSMLDPTKQGIITISQYREAMKALAISEYDQFPMGCDTNSITKETFIDEARRGLKKMTSTFKEN